MAPRGGGLEDEPSEEGGGTIIPVVKEPGGTQSKGGGHCHIGNAHKSLQMSCQGSQCRGGMAGGSVLGESPPGKQGQDQPGGDYPAQGIAQAEARSRKRAKYILGSESRGVGSGQLETRRVNIFSWSRPAPWPLCPS